MVFLQRLVIVVGAPGSGKDWLIRAVNDLGTQHAEIVPKHTSRKRWPDDGPEMICPGDPGHNLAGCDITYENYGDSYGIESARIWEGLRQGAFQVVVVSKVDAINKLHKMFGELVLLVYVHSETDAEEYRLLETELGKDTEYIARRAAEYLTAFDIYLRNFLAFEHVLIHFGLKEDLFDQIFRLFRAYERGDLYYTRSKPLLSERFWIEMMTQNTPHIIGGETDD
ncbi:MAG: hypothetical protein JXA14_17140 [Anaerolineae bacterium]|nr:hypothetical protein [Anaerolineae bacterium]